MVRPSVSKGGGNKPKSSVEYRMFRKQRNSSHNDIISSATVPFVLYGLQVSWLGCVSLSCQRNCKKHKNGLLREMLKMLFIYQPLLTTGLPRVTCEENCLICR